MKATEDSVPTINTSRTIVLTINPIVIDLIAPVDIPTPWSFTVGDALDSVSFSVFGCTPSCGTITYEAFLLGETDFDTLSSVLTFVPSTRTFNL